MTAKMFFGVAVPMTRLTKMYDSSPESCVHGVIYKLNFMSKALSYSEYRRQNGFLVKSSRL